MKKIVIIAGAVLAVMPLSSAFAADSCTLSTKAGAEATPAQLGAKGPVTPTDLVQSIYNAAGYSGVKAVCTQEQVLAKFVELNGSDAIAPDKAFKIPVIIVAPAATATSAPQAAPVTAPAAPKIAPSPELVQTRAQLADTNRQIESLRTALAARPKVTWTAEETGRVTKLEATKTDLLARVSSLETKMTAFGTRLDADEATLGQKANTADVYSKTDADATFATKADLSKVGGVPFLVKILLGLSLLGGVFGLLAFFRKSSAVSEPDLSGFVTVDDFEDRLGAVEARFKHVVEKTSETHLPAQMKAMKDGDRFTYHLKVDGTMVNFDAVKVGTTPSGDALIKIDVLASPVTAKQLFGALADYIENGGSMSTVKAVNA